MAVFGLEETGGRVNVSRGTSQARFWSSGRAELTEVSVVTDGK